MSKLLHRGLAFRIFASFVGAVLLFVALSSSAVFFILRDYDASWISRTVETVDSLNDALVSTHHERLFAKAPHRRAGRSKVKHEHGRAIESPELEEELNARVRIFPMPMVRRAVKRKVGMDAHEGVRGPPTLLTAQQLKRLRRGVPVVREHRLRPPSILWRLIEPETGNMVALVHVEPRLNLLVGPLAGLALLLLSLGAVAWPLSRSLTRRLHELEASTQAFANGDLNVRAQVRADDESGDEVDQLATSFNEMAARIATLITGQRSLLANVSHELRTPLARMRVLLELLEEKADGDAFRTQPELQRIRRGLAEMGDDVDEMNQLVGDLLTSGRLELGKELSPTPVDLRALSQTAAAKVDARVLVDEQESTQVDVLGDALLLERLVSNLLVNARRACPEGLVSLQVSASSGGWLLSVEDAGPGVPPDKREEIFDAFTRLDEARSRDQGGVGLGLYLSRQIASAHHGSLRCVDRPDGQRGARFELRLPRSATA